MDPKSWWQSKTIWANVIALVAAVGLWAQAGFGMTNMTTLVFPAVLAAVNVVLRLVTHQPID